MRKTHGTPSNYLPKDPSYILAHEGEFYLQKNIKLNKKYWRYFA